MRCVIDVRGKQSEWCIPCDLSKEAINDMRADGVDVKVIENSIPAWAVDAGLTYVWVFVQDLWNLKSPFRAFR